jgi:hypothetical protein
MSMIEDMTKEKQALSDEHQKQMDQTKGDGNEMKGYGSCALIITISVFRGPPK